MSHSRSKMQDQDGNISESTPSGRSGRRKAGRLGRKRPRGRRFGLWMLASVALLVMLMITGFFVLSGQPVTMPDWARARISERVNARLPVGVIGFGAVSVRVDANWAPSVQVKNLWVRDKAGRSLLQLRTFSVALSLPDLLRGRLRVRRIDLSGAQLSLHRARDGTFDLAANVVGGGASDGAAAGLGASGTLSQLLDRVDQVFENPEMASVEAVEADGLALIFTDERAKRRWVMTDGRLHLSQTADSVDISLALTMSRPAGAAGGARAVISTNGQNTRARASLSFHTIKHSPAASFGANVQGVRARDIASQVPALAWLGVVDAPISGAFRARIDTNGQLSAMNATLQMGAGALRPAEGIKPVGFTSGRAYLSYDPAAQKVRFDELSVETEAGNLSADGVAYLRDIKNGVPQTLLGQFHVDTARIARTGSMAAPVTVTGGAMDLRLRLDPFTLDIGQAVFQDGARRFSVKGRVHGDEKGWALRFDLGVNQITAPALLALWPLDAIPDTRAWIGENVLAGEVTDAKVAIRKQPGQKPVVSLGLNFNGAVVRFMNKMPPVTGGAGYATIERDVFTLVAQKGEVTAKNGEKIDVSGTVFQVTDINQKSAPAVVMLKTKSSLGAALSILDNPPFRFLSKAGLPTALATGRAQVSGEIRMPLAKKITFDIVKMNLSGTVTDVRSDKLVPGKILRSAKLEVHATEKGLNISGAGTLGRVPVSATWFQKFGPEGAGKSRLEGNIELSQRFVDEFHVGLPKGSVKGRGTARIEIDFRKGEAPRFRLLSDLNRLTLRSSDLDWSKPANTTGRLEVTGRLGTPPVIKKLILDAAGLRVQGAITLTPSGALKTARFSRVRVGGWLDAPVVLSGRGANAAPAVSVLGGTIDIRKTKFSGRSGAQNGGPLSLAPDRLVVSDAITLTGLKGTFSTRPAFNGTFTARVNGVAPIKGTLVPGKTGTMIRIQADDAGAVFRAAQITDKVYGGTLNLILTPVKGADGQYDGQMDVRNTTVKNAPALADLLGAISVVGLLEQLNSGGLVFNRVESSFRLTPHRLTITKSSATGASLGVSLDGIYDLDTEIFDMQGVISPIYLLNGIGQIFTRKGEGLFGVNFKLVGTADNPKVRVNPLSILTPGMFRNIFRKPPPKVSK